MLIKDALQTKKMVQNTSRTELKSIAQEDDRKEDEVDDRKGDEVHNVYTNDLRDEYGHVFQYGESQPHFFIFVLIMK